MTIHQENRIQGVPDDQAHDRQTQENHLGMDQVTTLVTTLVTHRNRTQEMIQTLMILEKKQIPVRNRGIKEGSKAGEDQGEEGDHKDTPDPLDPGDIQGFQDLLGEMVKVTQVRGQILPSIPLV